MTRLVLLTFLVLGVSVTHAEGMLPGGATLKFNRLLLHEDNSPDLAEPKINPDSLWHYFNLAHCVCSQFNEQTPDPAFNEGTFDYEVTVENYTTAIDRPVEVWVGTTCNTDVTTQRDSDCTKITTTGNVAAIDAAGKTNVTIPIFEFMTPKQEDRNLGGCTPRRLSAATWLMVDNDGDTKFEYSETQSIDTDSEAPPLPTEFKAVGAESAIEISWKPPTDVSDVYSYQALCATGVDSDVPGRSDPPAARYETPFSLCGANQSATLMPSDISSNTDPDAGVSSVVLSQQLNNLDPAFICGETTTSTATSLRLEGLKNGTPYTVVLLVIDKYGNAAGTYFTSQLAPVPATDFWEDLHDQGSGVEGGFCLLSQTYGDDDPTTNALRAFRDETLASTAFGRALTRGYYGSIGAIDLHGSFALRLLAALALQPLVLFALLWHFLTLPGLVGLTFLALFARRHRTWRLRLASVATLLVLFVPARAHAQAPYWEDQTIGDTQDELAIGDPMRVKWHAGIRVGPYVPGIDAQIGKPGGGKDGPYEQMFGGYSILPMLDVERFLWRGFGQLGVGVSVGYMGKSAHAWLAGSDPNDPMRPRAEGDTNKFKLFPFSVNAIYRFSYLDDEFGIPIVPYARAGLAYYVWWVDAPNGDFATACKGGGDDPMCAKTTAAGASMGFVGALGLAIRAERIDESAARSMRESGIEHAGFYGEYSIGKVDGFGSDKKLSLGDNTWFAGVDFEF